MYSSESGTAVFSDYLKLEKSTIFLDSVLAYYSPFIKHLCDSSGICRPPGGLIHYPLSSSRAAFALSWSRPSSVLHAVLTEQTLPCCHWHSAIPGLFKFRFMLCLPCLWIRNKSIECSFLMTFLHLSALFQQSLVICTKCLIGCVPLCGVKRWRKREGRSNLAVSFQAERSDHIMNTF